MNKIIRIIILAVALMGMAMTVFAVRVETEAVIFLNTVDADGGFSTGGTNISPSSTSTPFAVTSADTVTVSITYGPTISLLLTNNIVLFNFADQWPTTCVGRVTLDVNLQVYSFTFDPTIIGSGAFTLQANSNSAVFFRKNLGSTNWFVRQ